ncbi:hypothetical protein [Oceanicella actignis]|uniref:Uncharacterized protein n=1 Tax=Oceanicella actignis TaxID=1189325 RepID=A0A1M7TIV1_9RHOB|nr:hypothetical protein [Oceanicella actignis]SET65575.1 hypothetical protein SAMN04488119_1073 [Oceanicella actignis]SHN70689.1 hypothetical protein SAMN05216200_1072 [Oceanicella actignis]
MSDQLIDLNVFSNVASPDPAHNLAHHAIRSAFETFGPHLRPRLFVDPNPNPEGFDAWIARTREALSRLGLPAPEVARTCGLSDGFRQAIESARSSHAIMLEHDFVFIRRRIRHGLPELTAGMEAARITHLRFNKRWNRPVGYDYFMRELTDAPFPCCRVSGRSNNPQIIEIDFYRRRVLPVLDPAARKAAGLEGNICDFVGGGHVYGPLGHLATVAHLDGRRRRLKDGLARGLHLLRARAAGGV